MVTVPNEERESTAKQTPMEGASQNSRTIVRLNTKPASAGMDKVTVKSLDEIKREKEKRLKASQNSSSYANKQSDTTKQRLSAPSQVGGKRTNRTTVVATHAEPTSSASVSNPSSALSKLGLKEFTIPLSSLSKRAVTQFQAAQSSANLKTAVSSRTTEARQPYASNLLSEDFLDSENDDDSDDDDHIDEDYLLKDDEVAQSSRSYRGSQSPSGNRQDVTLVDYGDVQLGLRKSEEDDEETISIHADDSMFEEEEEFTPEESRLRPRLFGRKSAENPTKDLRSQLSNKNSTRNDSHAEDKERIDQNQANGDRTVVLESQQACRSREHDKEDIYTKAPYNKQNSGRTLSRQNSNNRYQGRGLSKQTNKQYAGRQSRGSFASRGKHAIRRGTGVRPSHPVSFLNPGGGILPLSNAGGDIFQGLQMLLNAKIQDQCNSIKNIAAQLWQSQPQPSESVPVLKQEFDNLRKRPDDLGPVEPPPFVLNYGNISGNKRLEAGSYVPKHSRAKNADSNSKTITQTNFTQENVSKKDGIPQWLIRTYQDQKKKEELLTMDSDHQRGSPHPENGNGSQSFTGEETISREVGHDLPNTLSNEDREIESTGQESVLLSSHNSDLSLVAESVQDQVKENLQGELPLNIDLAMELVDSESLKASDYDTSLPCYAEACVSSTDNGTFLPYPQQLSQNKPVGALATASETTTEMQCLSGKRKSPFQADDDHVSKVKVGSTPEGMPQPEPSPTKEPPNFPYGLCWVQIKRGECRFLGSTCKYRHLTPVELSKFRESEVLQNARLEMPQQLQEQQLDHQSVVMPQEGSPVPPMEDTVKMPAVSVESVIQLLNNKNLGAAWQSVERLYRLNNTIPLPLLERTLVLCSEQFDDPDTVAQVACKAFDMIGRVRLRHNRHDYTTLIKTLCNSGQYIRAYEMLDVMKKNSCAPTYDLFLDLVNASEKDPDWAFGLLDDIKACGLFMSDICSHLILLGCRSGEGFVDRTWFLFQEAIHSQVKPNPEAVSAMLRVLVQSSRWDEATAVINALPEAVPVEFLKMIMLSDSLNAEWNEAILALLSVTSEEKIGELGTEVWSTYLCNHCRSQTDTSFCQKIYSVMQQCNIPLTPECADTFMTSLCNANQWSEALELFKIISADPQVLEQLAVISQGLHSLTFALHRAAAGAGMLTVVHFMLNHHMKPDDSILMSALEYLDKEKNFLGIHQFFNQLQTANLIPPLAVYRQIVSSLEKWAENPNASTQAYAAMRQAHPVLQHYTEGSSRQSQEHPQQIVCRYFGTPKGCFQGNNCTFLHPLRSMSVPDETGSASGASISDGSTAVSQSGKRSTSLRGQYMNETKAADSDAETTPFVLQNSHCPTKNPQSQGQFCKFFASAQGCRKGDNCRYIHSQTVTSASSQLSTEDVSGASGRPSSCGNKTVNPFVLKGPVPASGAMLASDPCGARSHPSLIRPSLSTTKTSFPPAFRDPPQQATVKGQHFQLAGLGNFRGPNPFLPVFLGRTQSLDGFQSSVIPPTNNQVHSAPVIPERPETSCFRYPSKKNSQFYVPRIKFAGQENSWNDLAHEYISMKNEEVVVDDGTLQVFYEAFVINCPSTVGDCFEVFVKKINQLVDIRKQHLSPDHNPGDSFDEENKTFVGQLGVAFLSFCHERQNFLQGYAVLHVLHDYGINYSQYNSAFRLHQRPLSPSGVALLAADTCLKLDQPLYRSALEVLRGTNYALPSKGISLTSMEAEQRSRVFHVLCRNFIKEKNFNIADELLNNVGDQETFGNGGPGALYNEFLVALIQNNELSKAIELSSVMESNLMSKDSESVRALVNGLGNAGLTTQAKTHFLSGYFTGVYPCFEIDSPWTVTIKTSFSALECQFCLEKHLQKLHEFIEEQLVATGHQCFTDSYCRTLTVVIICDEAPRLFSGFMAPDEIIRCVRNMVITVLNADFNPPLACDDSGKDEEVTVNALSLKRWFRANPASGRFKKGSFSLGKSITSIELQNTSQHPYLQPGMSNVIVSSNGQGGERRRVSVLTDTDGQSPRQVYATENEPVLEPLSRKSVRDRIAHVISGRLKYYWKQGRIESKETFRQWARKLTQAYLRTDGPIIVQQNYEAGKERICQFVDEYFRDTQ